MALSADRNTPYRDGQIIAVAVAAGALIHAGALVVADATGFAAPGSTATDLTYLGRAEEHVDNRTGANGAQTVNVRRRLAFKWRNSAADTVTQARIGKPCYIVDDETVAASDGASARSPAGIVIAIDSDGVWVE